MCVRGAHACWLRARSLSLSRSRARSQEFDREKQKLTTDRDARHLREAKELLGEGVFSPEVVRVPCPS